MKKRHRRLKTWQQGSRRSLGLEHLEVRQLLATDIVLGPGTNEPRNEVPAQIRIDELEKESDRGSDRILNNSIAQAEAVPLGFGAGEFTAIDLRGELIEPSSVGARFSSEVNPPNNPPINDSSILLANRVNASPGTPLRYTGAIGDEPGGINEVDPRLLGGDADYYWLEEVEVGQVLSGHVQSSTPTVLILYDAFGDVIMTSDTNSAFRIDNFISYQVVEDGDYYFAIVPYGNDPTIFRTPANPFDQDTVLGGPTGNYTFTVGVDAVDMDYYAFELNTGDILGVNAVGSANLLTLYDPDGELMIESGQDLGQEIFPASSPLPVGGTSSLAYVIDAPGTYYLSANGYNWNKYLLELRLFRPVLESAPEGAHQILFLDFDGAMLNPEIFQGLPDLRNISPLSRFVPRWGLRDENALIDRIVSVVKENFDDLKRINPLSSVEVRNSRDHADPFGQPYVSRVIVGGTIGELTISTYGIADSVDVGNFDTEETAIVLLDILSGPRSDPGSLNHYTVAPGASKVDLVAAGVGNIVAHEASHIFGAFHTETFNSVDNIIDQGDPTSVALDIGVGDDLIWGTQDDVDVDFATDEYAFNEGFVGLQNTAAMLANVLVRGRGSAGGVGGGVQQGSFGGTVFNDSNGNGLRDPGEAGLPGARVYADVNNDLSFGIAEPSVLTGADGSYRLTGLPLRSDFSLRIIVPNGQQLTTPDGGHPIDVKAPPTAALDFGLQFGSGISSGIDRGDAPPSYGAVSHAILPGFSLGRIVDGEAGEITDDGPDDDGITLSNLVVGQPASGTAFATINGFSPGVLQGWIDFNRDGTFSASERIVRDLTVGTATTMFTFTVPAAAQAGATWARFRYGYERGIGPTGPAGAGEVEDYPVVIRTDGGGPTGPDAIDDSVTVLQGSVNFPIQVLANDQTSNAAPLNVIAVGTPDQGGAVSIAADGQSVLYTPLAAFTGQETFSYTISNGTGSDSALVSVIVEPDTGGEQIVRFRLQTVDANEEGVISEVTAGQSFVLQVYTQDLRPDGIGVYAAYLDVEFDADLATFSDDVTITYGSDYPAGQDGEPLAGLLDEVGAFAGTEIDLGTEELLLFSIPLTASGAGELVFSSNPAEVLPAHEVLLGDLFDPVSTDQIDYTSTSLIVNPVAAGAFTNPRNPLDVNDDGFVSPRDALAVINDMNANGVRSLANVAAAPISAMYIDVSGDLFLSAIDALMVINYLNGQSTAAAALAAVDLPKADADEPVRADANGENYLLAVSSTPLPTVRERFAAARGVASAAIDAAMQELGDEVEDFDVVWGKEVLV